MPNTLKKAAFLLAFISMLVFPAFADRTTIRPAWNVFTTQQDIEMGRILAGDVERTFRLATDAKAIGYITALGTQLSTHAPQYRYPYQFKIVHDDQVNVWALPGGFIYVSSGLIEQAQNEPELAGALAHAIAHVALRHGTAEVSQAYSNRGANDRARVSVNDVMSRLDIRFDRNSIPLRYSREEERQAAVVATQIMFDANFDPQQMTQFFQSFANDRSSRTREFFDEHPYLSNHAAVVRTETRNLGPLPRNVRGDSPDFRTIKDIVYSAGNSPNSLPSIDDRDRASGDQPDLPSSRMVTYRGRDIEFRHPENWRVTEDNDTITVAPDQGIVSGSLAYGMSIGLFEPQGRFGRNSFSNTPSRADNTSLSAATDQLIDHLQQSNPNMRVIRNSERMRVDGAQAMVVELSNDSPTGGSETDWLVTVLRPNGMLRYFVGVAPQREFSRYQSTFDNMMASVRFLD